MPRPMPTLAVETEFWTHGFSRVAGVDEVGRGCWAGPVFAGAVILPPDPHLPAVLDRVRDSKLLSPFRRESLVPLIQQTALAFGIGRAEAWEIDRHGIVPATRLAMTRALEQLEPPAEALIVDMLALPELPLPQQAFPYADTRCLSVAAASILAKVARDHWMVETAEIEYPGYGFARHKGYGTRQHHDALIALGACPLHRRTFRPVQTLGERAQ